jgi:hypothetical protein
MLPNLPQDTGPMNIPPQAVAQRGFPDAATRDEFTGGWSGVWDMLAPGEHETGSAG